MADADGAEYDKRIQEAIQCLRRLDSARPLGVELALAIARVYVSPALEAACLRRGAGEGVEILLTQRAEDDPAYPGEWHCPGTMLRPGEEFADAAARLGTNEKLGSIRLGELAGVYNNMREVRGHFLSVIYLCTADAATGTWYAVDALPDNTIAHHREHIIPQAVRKFASLNAKS